MSRKDQQGQQPSTNFFRQQSPHRGRSPTEISSTQQRLQQQQQQREFQNPIDFPSVTLRTVNLTQRSVFARARLPALETYQLYKFPKRLSPSYNHLRMLHLLNQQRSIYQVQFSPSTSEACTLSSADDEQQKNHRRDGRYRSIDIQAARDALPKIPPRITYKKHRLPNRADVGFANPHPDDVLTKQTEIREETAWEEHSPRLVVFLSSDQVGRTDDTIGSIEYAGRDLLAAKHRNAIQAGRKSHIDPNRIRPNPYSMLAPPLEALYSGSQGWRPRPIHDRPVGMRYCLCAPLAVSAKDMVGSLTLYSLPPMYKDKLHATAAAAAAYHCQKNQTVTAFGKISEAFWFPTSSDKLQRAIFAYDPMDLTMESNKKDPEQDPASVYVVLQLYKQLPLNDKDDKESQSGTLTPACFGIAKFFSKEETVFPEGKTKEIQLYKPPEYPESQAEFVERLWRVIQNRVDGVGEYILEDSKKKRGRRFRSPNSRSLSPQPSRSPPPSRNLNRTIDIVRFNATATLFLSSLKADFLQAMLSSPPQLEDKSTRKMLVDISGDFAVALDKSQVENIVGASELDINKRSSLIRLSSPPQPSGYCGDSNFREVLYLPARPDKQYDVDSFVGVSRVHLNLLYVYPRRLRRLDAKNGRNISRFTMRLRVVRVDESQASGCTTVRCFYNVAPWTGSSLVESCYTNVSCELAAADFEAGIPFTDELKMQLPVVLDGSYRFIFTLFSASSDPTIALTKVAEASVPLSSTTPRDGGSRVATVIPNGKHRLELGIFQLQFETRLVSSMHVGDPSVATVLRDLTSDYPNSLARSPSELNALQDIPALIEAASNTSAVSCFRVLLHMILLDVCNISSHGKSNSSEFADLSKLFDLLATVKTKFIGDGEQWSRLVKSSLDDFDERCFSSSEQSNETDEMSSFPEMPSEPPLQEITESTDDGSVRFRRKSRRQTYIEKRASRVAAALNASAAPFSRVAYGASKIDRMRAEAELHHENSQHFGPFFDDDETIATAPSLSSDKVRVETNGSFRINFGKEATTRIPASENSSFGENSIARTKSTQSKNLDEKLRSIGDTDFAKRVKTVASAILAPCVAPSLSRVLKDSSPKEVSVPSSEFGDNLDRAYGGSTMCLCAPGSDVDESEATPESDNDADRQAPVEDFPTSMFPSLESAAPDKRLVSFVYEVVIPTWIEAWLKKAEGPYEEESQRDYATSFLTHIDFVLPLCLKSLSLNYAAKMSNRVSAKLLLDEPSLRVLRAFTDVLGRGLLFICCTDDASTNHDRSLQKALLKLDVVMDFLVGLVSILELRHVQAVFETYFKSLHSMDIQDSIENLHDIHWDVSTLHVIKCTRTLLLRSVEKLVVLPSLVALNRPMKYSDARPTRNFPPAQWLTQGQPSESDQTVETQQSHVTTGWLAEISARECLSVCSLSCGVVVGEAIAHVQESSGQHLTPPLKNRPGASLKSDDLLMFQSMAIYSIEIFYELVIRRHAMDRRYQSDSTRSCVATVLSKLILEKSVESANWLTKMDPKHKIRSLWLLSFAYTLQEAPEALVCDFLAWCCDSTSVRIVSFLRLLRLCCSTFQGFLDSNGLNDSQHEPANDCPYSAWLAQESFNVICAATNLVVEVGFESLRSRAHEYKCLVQGVLEVLLQVLALPQSTVTQLRAVGSALQVLETDIGVFLDATGLSFQHWARIVLSLMNSTALSVRSISVDFIVSLLGGIFDLHGNIESVTLIFTTVLPEVVAREIGLYSISGKIEALNDVATTVWPMRRSFADLDDSNPLDDSRVDRQLIPSLSRFCRICQAIIDGVLVEMSLMGSSGQSPLRDVMLPFPPSLYASRSSTVVFDADEESLFEAAEFFLAEISPMQRIRWLLTLKALHEFKENWVEAAESLYLCARTICDCMQHLKQIWRPTRFSLWSENQSFGYLKSAPVKDEQNSGFSIVDFSNHFLEPRELIGLEGVELGPDRLQQPTVSTMCNLLTNFSKEFVRLYLKEKGMDQLAHDRLENLQKLTMDVVDSHTTVRSSRMPFRSSTVANRLRHAEEEASIRRVVASISGDMTKLAERLLRNIEAEPSAIPQSNWTRAWKRPVHPRSNFVAIRLYGKKPPRFQESTTIPTFLEWDKTCICRVPALSNEGGSHNATPERVCIDFAAPLMKALQEECSKRNVQLRTHPDAKVAADDITYLHIIPVEILDTDPFAAAKMTSKRFFHRKGTAYVETKVAQALPGALSRQSALLTMEFVSAKAVSH